MQRTNDKVWIEELLGQFLNEEIGVSVFCSEYENWWNFTAKKSAFMKSDVAALDDLLGVVALYTEHESDLKYYSGYKTALQVIDAVRETKRILANGH